MDVLKICVLLCIFGFAKSVSTSTEMVPPKGPCPGIQYRTRFNILSYFPFLFDVENEIYCVDNEGNEVDCELSCPQPLCDMKDVVTVFILLISACVKLKQIQVSFDHIGDTYKFNLYKYIT